VTNDTVHPPTRRRIRLLYIGDAALARECLGRPGGSIEFAESTGGDGTFSPARCDGASNDPLAYDILLIEHGHAGVDALAILQDVRDRSIHTPVIIVADWDERLAAQALGLGASDYVGKNRASFRAVYFRLHRLIGSGETTASHPGREPDELRRRLAEAEQARESAERRTRDAIVAIKQARQARLADAVAAANEHAYRESEFAVRIADTSASARALEQQFRDQRAILGLFEERASRAEQAVHIAARRQSELETVLREESLRRRSLETQLAHVNEAVREAEHRRVSDTEAFTDTLAEQHRELTNNLTEISRARELLDERLQQEIAAATHARERHAAEVAAVAERETTLLDELRTAQAERERLERRVVDADAAIGCAEQRVIAAHQAGQQRHNERQAEFHAELTRQRVTIDGLREDIAAVQLALQESEDRRMSEATAASIGFDNLQAQYEAHIAGADASRLMLQTRLDDAESALVEASDRHTSEIANAVRQLAEMREEAEARSAAAVAATRLVQQRLDESEAERQQQHERDGALLTEAAAQQAETREIAEQRIAEAMAATALVESRLRETEAARERAGEQHAGEMAQAIACLERQQRQTETWLTDAAAIANALEDQLADARIDLERVRRDAAAERDAAIAHASEQQAAFQVRLAQEVTARNAIDEQLRQTRSAADAAADRHAAAIAAADARLADSEERSGARLAQAEMAIKVAESKRAEAIAALNRVVQQATAERQAASAETAERYAHFKAELAREAARRDAIERELVGTRTAAEDGQRRSAEALAAAEARAREERTEFERRAAHEHTEWERVGLAAADRIEDLDQQLRRARQSVAEAEEQIARLSLEHQEERAQSERRQRAADRELVQLGSDRDTLQQSLDHTRATADEILTRVTQDRSIERARLEAIAADLGTQLQEQAATMRATEQAAAARLAEAEHRLREMHAAKNRGDEAVSRLERDLRTLGDGLEAAKRGREIFRAAAERVPHLERELDGVRAEHRRQFDENPASWLRCQRSGEIVHANRAVGHLLGYDPADLERLDFGDIVFDSSNDFRWVLDRCLASLSTQSMETLWKRKDGRRIIVRLIAVPATADAVDLVAEDITHVRQLEERLRNSQRMESVARYGSEVAVTCKGLLKHVKDEGQQWLAGIDSDTVRYRGELLLEEVTRAAAYLGQLASYSEEQQNVPDLVDVNKVLRDLEPVLKRVAGENIDVVLPAASAALNLDVEARPVERMLVNVAAYGRERMPLGGRLKIDVDSVVVDREFVARHPNVRPGEHVLLIVNEQRHLIRPDAGDVASESLPASSTFSGDSPGVDLGVLQELVSACGGHLWMRAEPPGDMELKIHLPRRVLDRSEALATPIASGRSRWIRRAFGVRQ
jgi:PAS domain S-box-containing protein